MTEGSCYNFCIDSISVGSQIEVSGWAFHQKYGACDLKILVDGQPAPGGRSRNGLSRRDVAIALENPQADRSGFRLACRLPVAARSVSLQLEGLGGKGVLPLLERYGSGHRDWRLLASDGARELSFRFLTDRGLGFANSLVCGGRLGQILAKVGTTPLPSPPIHPVSIVVPVFGGKIFLPPLMRSLLENTDHRHPVFFVDDGNTDQTISAFLVALRAAHDHITVVQMAHNSGYVGATSAGVRIALQRNPEGHVVVLNTDTEVPPYWIERLVAPLDASPKIASATPLTNAGTICGFPMMPGDNPMPLGGSVDVIDAVVRGFAVGPLEIPTGVGFCMAFSRQVLNTIGFFDTEAFGRGYGEEVDWCRRALSHGFVNVLVPTVFVRHKHGGSFSVEEKAVSIEHSSEIIRQRYPSFDAEVQDYIAADPPAPLRAAALLRLSTCLGGISPVVVFDHGDSGGAVWVRQKEMARLIDEGRLVVLVQPSAETRADMPEAAVDITVHLALCTLEVPSQGLADLAAVFSALSSGEILVNSLVGFEGLGELLRLIADKRQHGMTVKVMHHDFFPLCPSFTLIGSNRRFCALPSPDHCAICLPQNREARGVDTSSDIMSHRRAWADLMEAADRHIFFSRGSAALMRRIFSLRDQTVLILPHLAEPVISTSPLPLTLPRRVAIVGGINIAKGSDVVDEMVSLTVSRNLPLSFELFGNIDRQFTASCFHDNGPYTPENLSSLLIERKCNIILIPSIWPETHSLVFDEVIALGRPVVIFDIGAPAERARFFPNVFVVSPISAEAALTRLLA
ncbi:glycosyltransferase [Pararhodospirillum photometricum]|uniref:glycosyltransferase n=1 Tax=Pararhodospirillum photometricum TaxID=1084 RepID=UPI00031CC34C|nr:glycosyltransferase [Pararhodospirillum photometricum]